MFSVGEFSTLAQVSKRLLRYYDEIGLLTPARTDASTGYRFYSAEQMAQLNRILVLKDLGLSLEQIRRLLSDQVSTTEMQGMLLLKKAEIEQQMQTELQRIRGIESRLQFIHNTETRKPLNVVLKQIAAQPVVHVRGIFESFEHAMNAFAEIGTLLPATVSSRLRYIICHSDGIIDRDMELELGYFTDAKPAPLTSAGGGLKLQYRVLPAVEKMATFVVKGGLEHIHSGYMEIGTWAEENGYRLAGSAREINLQAPRFADGRDLITEIQFPVAYGG